MMYDSWDIQAWRTEFFVILGHFLPFEPRNNTKNHNLGKMKKKAGRYYHFTLLYHKWRSYDVWFLRYGARQTDFLSFWFIFCPFNPKNQNFEKMKKIPRDIILHKCTINENHMYGSWDMKCVILSHFLPF